MCCIFVVQKLAHGSTWTYIELIIIVCEFFLHYFKAIEYDVSCVSHMRCIKNCSVKASTWTYIELIIIVCEVFLHYFKAIDVSCVSHMRCIKNCSVKASTWTMEL